MSLPAGLRDRRVAAASNNIVFPSGVRRHRDPTTDTMTVRVFPGEHYVTRDSEEMLVTVLGSCVAACVRDPLTGIGGMNHFMLPESPESSDDTASSSMRYGNVAMERLINEILSRGGQRHRLQIKVFGGGNVMRGNSNIGHRNADFVESYLAAEQLEIAASHLRGLLARRIHYFPITGKVMMLELRRSEEHAVANVEAAYQTRLQSESVAGSAELF